MPSLDFVRDLTDKLKTQGIDFFIFTIQKGKQKYRLDIFHEISSVEIMEIFDKAMSEVKQDMNKARQELKAKVKKK
jgi:hypothetical protein